MDWITTTAHHLLLGILLTIGIGICIAVIACTRRARDPLPRYDDKPDWIIGSAFVVVILAGNAWLDLRDLRNIDAAVAEQRRIKAGYFPADRARLNVNLNQCPPRTDGMTDHVVMAIATRADGGHTVTGCSRISHRQYQVKPREQVRG
jgi:hypothetical protein